MGELEKLLKSDMSHMASILGMSVPLIKRYRILEIIASV